MKDRLWPILLKNSISQFRRNDVDCDRSDQRRLSIPLRGPQRLIDKISRLGNAPPRAKNCNGATAPRSSITSLKASFSTE
jgi:hypothetical protein